jgi:enoyl-CoA hydratase/carnithine racemase
MADNVDERVVSVGRKDKIGHVVLDRPGQINAINNALRTSVGSALRELDADPNIAVIIISGAGARGFCAGADIKDQHASDSLVGLRRNLLPGWIDAFDQISKPIIAAIHGYCLGGGLEIAMACDIRIAAPDAMFGLPETGLGLIPGGGGTQRLPRIVGLGRALDLLLTGDRLDAQEAHRIGLVSRVASSGETLLDEAYVLAAKIAGRPTGASAYAKEAAKIGLDMSLADGLRLEKDLFVLLMSTEDRREAAAAFKEKRPPNFTGR